MKQFLCSDCHQVIPEKEDIVKCRIKFQREKYPSEKMKFKIHYCRKCATKRFKGHYFYFED
jgi:ribosomal protein S26